MNISNLAKNWKTTSAGITLIMTGVIHIGFAIKNGTLDEMSFTTTMVSILTGVGLIVAGDSSTTTDLHEETKAQLADLQSRVATVENNTATIRKPVTNT